MPDFGYRVFLVVLAGFWHHVRPVETLAVKLASTHEWHEHGDVQDEPLRVRPLRVQDLPDEVTYVAGGTHGHHHDHDHLSAEERAYAWCLMFSVVIVMCMFYLVNYPDPDIRSNTWQMLSMTVSIFVSVLLYGSLKTILMQIMGATSERSIMWLNFSLFVSLFLALQVILYLMMMRSRSWMTAVSGIMAHITGFSAMFWLAGMQALPPFDECWICNACLVAFVAAVLVGSSSAGAWVREKAAMADDGVISEAERGWMEQVEDVENDVYSLCLGFSIMQLIRFSVKGELPPFEPHEAPEHVTQTSANLLLVGCAGLGILSCTGTWLMVQFAGKTKTPEWAVRAMRGFQNIFSTSMAWCFLFWGEWQLYVLGYASVRIADLMLVALLLTSLSFGLILILDAIADAINAAEARVLRTLILSLGLMVGFTWERSFDVGLGALSAHHAGQHHWWYQHIYPLLLAAIVLPAWKNYILPNAIGTEIESEMPMD